LLARRWNQSLMEVAKSGRNERDQNRKAGQETHQMP